MVQVAMGCQQHHLHLFGKGDTEYSDNARDETALEQQLIGGDSCDHRKEGDNPHQDHPMTICASGDRPASAEGHLCRPQGVPNGIWSTSRPGREA
ncbi:hypothetical protein [Streptosporangium sp. NPDC006013]|uniref:hypothetical protein n=1 Tax=unclassified Streptosporangium TaxID=2632669 RepID=UPI0033A1F33A